MPRTLLTGANGFVGKILCSTLQQAGHHVIALSSGDSTTSLADENIVCDIRDYDQLEGAVRQAKPDYVIHLAAVSNVAVSFKDPMLTWQTNVMGTLNLLEALRLEAPKAFFVFVSSSEVYGEAFKAGVPLTEDAPCLPMNPYAASKLAAELAVIQAFRQGMPGVTLRPFNHIGVGQSADFVTASFARQIALIEAGQQTPQLKVGNLQAERDFLDVRDVCNVYVDVLKLASRSEEYPRVLNISSGEPRKIQTILDTLLKLSDQKIEVVQDAERMRPSDIPSASGNSEAIRALTGWQPQYDLRQTLDDLLNHWRQTTNSAA
jgi:GDP-4-dehydro-6-deoxy-D-mannose reductase